MTGPHPTTLGEAVALLESQFQAADIDTWRIDARLLVAEAAGTSPQDVRLYPDRPLTDEQASVVLAFAGRRMAREPVSRIFGRRGFWTLDLAVTPDTLDPRPDTETLVDLVLAALPDRTQDVRFVDLGTGTGCILLALLSEYPKAQGLGVDASAGAVSVAAQNAQQTGLADRADMVQGDWASGLPDYCADVVVSNPPYIAESEIADLDRDVRDYDPMSALVAGADGLDAYRTMIPQAFRIVIPGGLVALEIGQGQADAVAALMAEAGFEDIFQRADLAGITRCVAGWRPIG